MTQCSRSQFVHRCLLVLACCMLANAKEAFAVEAGPRVVKRGLTAKFQFKHSRGDLRSVDDQSIDAPVLVRLEKSLSETNGDQPSSHDYTLWFFGAVAGDYELSDYVVGSDGLPLPEAEALSGLRVRVVSELPPSQGTSLYEIDDPALRLRGGYRAGLAALGLAWLSVPFIWAYFRWRNRPPVVIEEPIAVPTLADQIRPLVQRAYEGKLSVEEQSRMEFVLYRFWQQRVGLPESMMTALPVLRQHTEAGELLRTFEAWVHAPDNARPELDSETLDQLLLPYRDAEANEDALESVDDFGSGDRGALLESVS